MVSILAPKNKNSLGFSQHALVRDSGTVAWAAWMKAALPPDQKVWPYTRQRATGMMHALLRRVGLSRVKLGLGSLRPGGTTFYFLNGVDVPKIKFMGRWVSESSLSSYVQEIMSILVFATLEASESRLVETLVSGSKFAWAGPPAVCLSSVCLQYEWRPLVGLKLTKSC